MYTWHHLAFLPRGVTHATSVERSGFHVFFVGVRTTVKAGESSILLEYILKIKSGPSPIFCPEKQTRFKTCEQLHL